MKSYDEALLAAVKAIRKEGINCPTMQYGAFMVLADIYELHYTKEHDHEIQCHLVQVTT